MRTLEEYLAEQIAKSPTFAAEYEKSLREMRFAVSLAMLREKRGLTQQALAKKTGIKQPMLARLEKGQIPTVPTLQRLARALDGRIIITAAGDVRMEPEPKKRVVPAGTQRSVPQKRLAKTA